LSEAPYDAMPPGSVSGRRTSWIGHLSAAVTRGTSCACPGGAVGGSVAGGGTATGAAGGTAGAASEGGCSAEGAEAGVAFGGAFAGAVGCWASASPPGSSAD